MEWIDYKIKNKFSNLRWQNWEEFVEIIKWEKKHKIAILAINFNNFENTRKLLEYLAKETIEVFDIVLIENSTKQEEEDKFNRFYKDKGNITVIKPINNLWSAGWYALGMEYIINNGYEYFFIVEDDVIFCEHNVFDDMIKNANENTLTFINNCKNTWESQNPTNKGQSWRVQTAGYPVHFIKKVGVIDPRYFFRGEDLERWSRIKRWIKTLWYKTEIINHNYIHPYLKSINGNYARFYFSIRNQLLSLEKQPRKNYTFIITLFFYLRTSITKIFVEKDSVILKSFLDAVWDFCKHDFSFENNKHKIWLFLNSGTGKTTSTWISREDFSKMSKDFYGSKKLLSITWVDMGTFSFSTNIWNAISYGLLMSSSSTIFYPISLLAPRVICINEFRLTDNMMSIYKYKNYNFIANMILIMISFVVSIVVIIIVDVIIILLIALNKCLKKS